MKIFNNFDYRKMKEKPQCRIKYLQNKCLTADPHLEYINSSSIIVSPFNLKKISKSFQQTFYQIHVRKRNDKIVSAIRNAHATPLS